MNHIKTYLIIHNLTIIVLLLCFPQARWDRLHAALLATLNHHGGNSSLVAASFKKIWDPLPLKFKQLQTLNIYSETCASHRTKTKSLYQAGLLGLYDHKLLYIHTYMGFLCIILYVCVCVCLWYVCVCPCLSACVLACCLCWPVCLCVCSIDRQACREHIYVNIQLVYMQR